MTLTQPDSKRPAILLVQRGYLKIIVEQQGVIS